MDARWISGSARIGQHVCTQAANLTRDERSYQYEYDYDYENRIVQILDANSDTVAQFACNGLDQRTNRFTSKA
jgi:hypothetical protein